MRLHRRKKETNGESAKALEEAHAHVEEAKSREPEVKHLAGRLRQIREENHFAEQIYEIMTGHPHGRSH